MSTRSNASTELARFWLQERFDVDLSEGTYQLICTVPGHEAMTAVLTVSSWLGHRDDLVGDDGPVDLHGESAPQVCS